MNDPILQQELLASIGAESFSTLLDAPVPGFLFEGCFRDKSLTMLSAPAHRGKTLLMLEMAICLDFEFSLFGQFRPMKGRECFFIGVDAPRWDYRLLTQKLMAGHGLSPLARRQTTLHGRFARGLNLADPGVINWLRSWRRLTDCGTLFIDSFRAATNINENDSLAMKQLFDILCSMRDEGWAIIFAHHHGKLTEIAQADVHASRGSTVIADSTDFIYTLMKPSKSDTRITMTCTKGRGGQDAAIPTFDITYLPTDEFVAGERLSAIRLTSSVAEAQAAILAVLSNGPKHRRLFAEALLGFCNNDLPTAVKFADNRVAELRRLGRIVPDGHGVWRLKEPPYA